MLSDVIEWWEGFWNYMRYANIVVGFALYWFFREVDSVSKQAEPVSGLQAAL